MIGRVDHRVVPDMAVKIDISRPIARVEHRSSNL
jgi:hypothetical protein